MEPQSASSCRNLWKKDREGERERERERYWYRWNVSQGTYQRRGENLKAKIITGVTIARQILINRDRNSTVDWIKVGVSKRRPPSWLFQPSNRYWIPDPRRLLCLLRETRRRNWNLSNASGTPSVLTALIIASFPVRKSLHGYLDAQGEYSVVFLVWSGSPRVQDRPVAVPPDKRRKETHACMYARGYVL